MPFYWSDTNVNVTPARRMPSGRIRPAGWVRPSTRSVKVPKERDEPGIAIPEIYQISCANGPLEKKPTKTRTDPVLRPPPPPVVPPSASPSSQPPRNPLPAPQQPPQSKTKEETKPVKAATRDVGTMTSTTRDASTMTSATRDAGTMTSATRDAGTMTSALQGQSTTESQDSVTPAKPEGVPPVRQARPAPKQARSGGPSGRQEGQVAAPQVQPEAKKAGPERAKAPEQTASEASLKAPKSILKTPKKRVRFATPLEQFSKIAEEAGSSCSSCDSFTDWPVLAKEERQAPSENSSDDSFTERPSRGERQFRSSSYRDAAIEHHGRRRAPTIKPPSRLRYEYRPSSPGKRPEPSLSARPAGPADREEKGSERRFRPGPFSPQLDKINAWFGVLPPQAAGPGRKTTTPSKGEPKRVIDGPARTTGRSKYVPPSVSDEEDEGEEVDWSWKGGRRR